MRKIFSICAMLAVGCGAADENTGEQPQDDAVNAAAAVTSCVGVRNGTACDDHNACTVGERCRNNRCTGGTVVVCAASDQCHSAGTCNATTGACSNPAKANGASCNDGNACTTGDICQSGVCVGGSPVVCTSIDQCHLAGTCVPSTGTCSSPVKTNGSACNDANACTRNDVCQNGVCVGGNPVVCSALDQCHTAGTCNTSSGVCSSVPLPNGTACSGGTCQGGICVAGASSACAAGQEPFCGTCVQTRGVATITPCNGLCPSGYGLCTGPGFPPYCARTRWDFEEGTNGDLNFEWNSGDGSAIQKVRGPRVHAGNFSAEILSSPDNWNTQSNMFMCGATNFAASMDLRSKTFSMFMFFDGPALSGATCTFGVFDGTGAEILPLAPFPVQFGTWFLFSKFLGSSTLAQAADLNFQCNFGSWSGNLFIDDISVN